LRSVWAALSRFFLATARIKRRVTLKLATVQGNLLTEIGDNLVQEDGGLLLLE